MVARRSVCVSIDEEILENMDIDIEGKISHYLNQGNIAVDWEIEDYDNGFVEVDDEPQIKI